MKILFVKAPSIFTEGLVGVVGDEFGAYEVKAYSPVEQRTIMNENAELVIIDLDTTVDVQPIINFYLKEEKKVIVWTANLDNSHLVELFKENLAGYFYNGMEKEELITALESVIQGKVYINTELYPILLGDYRKKNAKNVNRPIGVFTNREWEVLELLIMGYSNEKIAGNLYVTEKTVKTHMSSILRKLNVPDRTNVVLTALKNEWFYI
ncbi:response regulator transcription factor [Aquibacillus kalidii]|uniref:response regulator transcription factor n=1 Tax=Aquibacillus kalidii TaxID=2762597 RepID=UPI001647CCDA|nr:response regulator transcription factor [Aquibacillus kalidii]